MCTQSFGRLRLQVLSQQVWGRVWHFEHPSREADTASDTLRSKAFGRETEELREDDLPLHTGMCNQADILKGKEDSANDCWWTGW